MTTSLYITHMIVSILLIAVMIGLYLRSNKHQDPGIKNSLMLVYSLVLIGASLFALRYYKPMESSSESVLALSQVLSYFLFFAALWHILMALVASGIEGISSANNENKSAVTDYDPDGKSIINI
jgi:hypothetical protein